MKEAGTKSAEALFRSPVWFRVDRRRGGGVTLAHLFRDPYIASRGSLAACGYDPWRNLQGAPWFIAPGPTDAYCSRCERQAVNGWPG